MCSNSIEYVGAAACLGNSSPKVWKSFRRDCTHTHTRWFCSWFRLAQLCLRSQHNSNATNEYIKSKTDNFYTRGKLEQYSSANYFSFPIRAVAAAAAIWALIIRTVITHTRFHFLLFYKLHTHTKKLTQPCVTVCVTIFFSYSPLWMVEGGENGARCYLLYRRRRLL